MEDRIPAGDDNVKSIDLSKNLRCKNKAKNRDFQANRNFYSQLYLNPAWNIQQKQRENA